MKNGLIEESGKKIYYENGKPVHKGAVKIDGAIYYITHGGVASTGRKRVHSEMTNGLLKSGYYTFDEDGKLIKGSFKASQSSKKRRYHRLFKKRSLRKQEKRLMVAIAVLILIIFGMIAYSLFNLSGPDMDPLNDSQVTETVIVSLPTYDEEVFLCNDFLKPVYTDGVPLSNIANQISVAYKPYTFQYKITLTPIAEYKLSDVSAVLRLSESRDFADYKEFTVDPTLRSLSIDNLKTNTTYYYTLDVTVPGEETKHYDDSFKTAKTPRFLSIPNLINVRDIGGYEAAGGKKVKEGMIIRGSEIDGFVKASLVLNKEAFASMRSDFNFVYDMDLRDVILYSEPDKYQSALGENVQHKFYTAPEYAGIFNEVFYSSLKEIFTDLADPNKYPMYLHCTYGADRTGTIVFLLQGVLGVDLKDMKNEYALSRFTISGRADAYLNPIISGVEGYDGDTINEKIVSYLKTTIGVTDQQIDSIRNILLEDSE